MPTNTSSGKITHAFLGGLATTVLLLWNEPFAFWWAPYITSWADYHSNASADLRVRHHWHTRELVAICPRPPACTSSELLVHRKGVSWSTRGATGGAGRGGGAESQKQPLQAEWGKGLLVLVRPVQLQLGFFFFFFYQTFFFFLLLEVDGVGE